MRHGCDLTQTERNRHHPEEAGFYSLWVMDHYYVTHQYDVEFSPLAYISNLDNLGRCLSDDF